MSKAALTGITWDHSRTLPCLVATAQRWEETHRGVDFLRHGGDPRAVHQRINSLHRASRTN